MPSSRRAGRCCLHNPLVPIGECSCSCHRVALSPRPTGDTALEQAGRAYLALLDTDQGEDNSVEMLEWATAEYNFREALRTALRPTPAAPRMTHGRHCRCSSCARQDWTLPHLAPCGMHGPSCPAEYQPESREAREASMGWTRSTPAASQPALTVESLATLRRAISIGAVSYDGDGWFASDAGLVEEGDDIEALFDEAAAILAALRGEAS